LRLLFDGPLVVQLAFVLVVFFFIWLSKGSFEREGPFIIIYFSPAHSLNLQKKKKKGMPRTPFPLALRADDALRRLVLKPLFVPTIMLYQKSEAKPVPPELLEAISVVLRDVMLEARASAVRVQKLLRLHLASDLRYPCDAFVDILVLYIALIRSARFRIENTELLAPEADDSRSKPSFLAATRIVPSELSERELGCSAGVYARKSIRAHTDLPELSANRAAVSGRMRDRLERKGQDFAVCQVFRQKRGHSSATASADDTVGCGAGLLDTSTVRPIYAVLGPLALLNAGCAQCVNAEDQNWRTARTIRRIERGEQILISYCTMCDDAACEFRRWKCAREQCPNMCCASQPISPIL
jgi:hypothetical protein